MKPEETRVPAARHQFDHAVPTVIHHPEEDRPVLANWVDHAMQDRKRFWTVISAAVLGVFALVVIASSFSGRRAESDEAWTKLETAKSASDRVEIAKDYPKTPASFWALLQAATEFYSQAFADLPANKEHALPLLTKAYDLFEQVATEAPADSPQARVAALGLGRTLEAQNKLDKAIAQYEKVANTKGWAATDEAREAARLAKLLAKPESVAFYKELYAFKPVEAKLPPGGTDKFSFPMPFENPLLTPGSGSGSPPSGMVPGAGSAIPSIDLRNLPPAPAPMPKGDSKPAADLPADPFAPPVIPPSAPADPPKAEAKPATEPAPAPAPKPEEKGKADTPTPKPDAAPKS